MGEIMKFFLAVLLATVVVSAAMPVQTIRKGPYVVTFEKVEQPNKLFGCSTCASLTGQGLNVLLNYILNAGVVGGCGKLCGQLKDKTAKTVCSLACDLVGIKVFVKALEKADLDPIYFCQELGACKADDNGEGKITDLSVSPQSGQAGTTFAGLLTVAVTNHTGAGEFRFSVTGGAQQAAGTSSIFPELNPGTYSVKISVDTTPSQDPTQGPSWMPGNYNLGGAFCMGECGSKHPHTKNFGEMSTNFTISA